MTSTSSPAGFPESALRAVLAGCVSAWARSAVHPANDEGGEPPRLLYVDAFAGAEMAFGTGVARAAEDETRAAAAIRALDEAAGGATVNALFVEEDPSHLQRVYADLERVAGGERLRATRDLASLEPGEASLLESDFRNAASEVGRFCDGARALLLLAPPTARKLPWEVLRPLAARDGVDLLVRFPHTDWEKQQSHFASPLADIPAFARRIVEGASAMLGDAKHEWLPAWRAAARNGIPAALEDVLGRFQRLLEGAAPGRVVQPAALQAGGATAYLFLVTSDPALAQAFNAAAGDTGRAATSAKPAAVSSSKPQKASKPARSRKAAPDPVESPALAEAAAPEPAELPAPTEVVEPVAAPETTQPVETAAASVNAPESTQPAKPAEAPQSHPEPIAAPAPVPASAPAPPADIVLDLFGDSPPKPDASASPAVALAESLAARYAGRTVAWRNVLRDLAATGATADEAKRALATLKRGGRAVYGALKDDASEIEFPRDPAPPAPAAPRKRKHAAGDAGFFGQEE